MCDKTEEAITRAPQWCQCPSSKRRTGHGNDLVGDERREHRPCLVLLAFNDKQRNYTERLCNLKRPIYRSMYTYLDEKYRDACPATTPGKAWGTVAAHLEKHAVRTRVVSLPRFSTSQLDAKSCEEAYQREVLKEGFEDIVGFASAADGFVPFADYFSARLEGATARSLEWIRHSSSDSNNSSPSGHTRHPTDDSRGDDDGTYAEAPLPELPVRHNLYGNEPSTSIRPRQDKHAAQQQLGLAGVGHIRSTRCRHWEAAESFRRKEGIPFPVIVKPVSGGGSEFVSLCHSAEEIETAFQLAKGQGTTQGLEADDMVLEEFIEGSEYVVNTVSYRGHAVVTDVWRSWKFPSKSFSTRLRFSVEDMLTKEAAHSGDKQAPVKRYSTNLLYDRQEFVEGLASLDPQSEERRVVAYTLRCLEILGMENGAAHCEVRVDERPGSATRGQPILIELNPRVQGDSPRAMELVGYSQFSLLYYLAVASATFVPKGRQTTTDAVPWPPVPQLYAASLQPGVTRHVVFLTAPYDGVVNGRGVAAVIALPTFRYLTRGSVFKKSEALRITHVVETMDLLSCPGACVLEGTQAECERDTARIRSLERASWTPVFKVLARFLARELRELKGLDSEGEKEVTTAIGTNDGCGADEEGHRAALLQRIREMRRALLRYAGRRLSDDGLCRFQQIVICLPDPPLYMPREEYHLLRICAEEDMLLVARNPPSPPMFVPCEEEEEDYFIHALR